MRNFRIDREKNVLTQIGVHAAVQQTRRAVPAWPALVDTTDRSLFVVSGEVNDGHGGRGGARAAAGGRWRPADPGAAAA